jgi:cardiolipin synthase
LLGWITSAHVILYKRDYRSAFAWVAVIWFVPLFGVVFYFLFGINRIKRKALVLRSDQPRFCALPRDPKPSSEILQRLLPPESKHLTALATFVDQITQKTLLPGNQIISLQNGDETYPEMLRAIDEAKRSISLCSFIFNADRIGNRFLEALVRAKARGVEVRVIIDAVGARYSLRSMVRACRRKGVPVAAFLPTYVPWLFAYMNLRSHRKILIVDGKIGFTGGINIRDNNILKDQSRNAVKDLHFRMEGPIVRHLQETFAEDWAFCTREILEGEAWFPACEENGLIQARGIDDGPQLDLDPLRWTILGALSCARKSVRIVTPYFVPDQSLITALNICALKGVQVDIILPQKNNLALVKWASMAILWQVLERGCRVWFSPAPFDHSKLMVIDQTWVLLGSANWDLRSLRLNFEFNVECYDPGFGQKMDQWVQGKIGQSKKTTLEEVNARPLPVRLRNGIARLLTPYL